MLTFQSPDSPSMYSRPVESLISAPSPDTQMRAVLYDGGVMQRMHQVRAIGIKRLVWLMTESPGWKITGN